MNYKIENKIIALIPARSGSKSIPHKNIKIYKNIPLLVHSIIIAKKSKYINEIYVSTDSKEYKEISEKYGAIVPFIRPSTISDDLTPDIDVFKHFIEYYNNTYKYIPKYIVHLRPTYPNRNVELLDHLITIFTNNSKYSSLRTVVSFDKSPYKMYNIINTQTESILSPLFKHIEIENTVINEPYNQCRQILPTIYLHNGCIDIIDTKECILNNSMTGNKIMPYIMNNNEIYDIDTIEDWNQSEKAI